MKTEAKPGRLEVREEDGSVTIFDLRLGELETIVTPRTPSDDVSPADPLRLEQPRYKPRRIVGRGGFGSVLEVQDSRLGRVVAAKVGQSARGEQELVKEGLLTARLQHPNIVPVYDVDHSDDGRSFYTMKLLEGESLKAVLSRIGSGDERARQRFPRSRLVADFRSICMAVHYAHEQGVIHRDIKPANIVLGRFGEVVLADWGLAGSLDELSREDPGVVRGTPAYMAPERFDDVPCGSIATDVFALGATLYEILTYRPPRRGSVSEIFRQLSEGPPPLPRTVHPDVPEELERLCMAALDPDPASRPASAGVLAQAVEEHLDREREDRARRERAQRTFANAGTAVAAHRDAVEALRARGEALVLRERDLSPQTPLAEREALWDEQRLVEDARIHVVSLFGRATQLLESVLMDDPWHVEARRELAQLYFGRFCEAEEEADRADAAYFENVVRRHDEDGTFVAQIERTAEVHFECTNVTCSWSLHRYEARGPLLEPRLVEEKGKAAKVRFQPKQGSYLLVASSPGCPEARIPFTVGRGDVLNVVFRMYAASELPPSHVVVRGASADFAIGELPVTVAEYLDFVNVSWKAGEEVDDLLPRRLDDGAAYFELATSGWGLPTSDLDGDQWLGSWPMILVTAAQAERYADFRSTERFSFRLPTKEEWELAAGGADSRPYPWGLGYDESIALLRTIDQTVPLPRPVGTMSRDVSPFGVRDLGGGVTEWTSTVAPNGARVLKGASYRSWREDAMIAKDRLARPSERMSSFGFRLAVTLGYVTEIHK